MQFPQPSMNWWNGAQSNGGIPFRPSPLRSFQNGHLLHCLPGPQRPVDSYHHHRGRQPMPHGRHFAPRFRHGDRFQNSFNHRHHGYGHYRHNFQHVNRSQFACESCNRRFRTESEQSEHMAEHITCGIDGCTLSAHPGVIAKHIELQHISGLFRRMCTKDSPEDIAKWIEERKRSYPRFEVVKKASEDRLKRMISRRERMQLEMEMECYEEESFEESNPNDVLVQPVVSPCVETSFKPSPETPGTDSKNKLTLVDYSSSDSDVETSDLATDVPDKPAQQVPEPASQQSSDNKNNNSECENQVSPEQKKAMKVSPPRPRRRFTFLHRIYNDDVKRDQLAILQCIDFIVGNNMLSRYSGAKNTEVPAE